MGWTVSGDDDFRQSLDEMCMSLNELTAAGAPIEVTFYDNDFDEEDDSRDQDSRDDFVMLFVGPTPADIMLEGTLRDLAAGSAGALSLTFVASHATDEELRARPGLVRASMRALDADALAALLALPRGPTTMVCVCGPDGFAKHAKALLAERFENVLVW